MKSSTKHKHKHRKWVNNRGLGLGACIGGELRKNDGRSWVVMEEERIEEVGGNEKYVTGRENKEMKEKQKRERNIILIGGLIKKK